MFNKIRTIALSVVIGLGTLAAVPATAQADSFYFGITPNGPSFGFRGGDSSHHWDRRHWDRRHWDRRHHRSECSDRAALRKADRMGINRARVRWSNRHVVRVSGRSHGRHVAVTFANERHCPIVAWR